MCVTSSIPVDDSPAQFLDSSWQSLFRGSSMLAVKMIHIQGVISSILNSQKSFQPCSPKEVGWYPLVMAVLKSNCEKRELRLFSF